MTAFTINESFEKILLHFKHSKITIHKINKSMTNITYKIYLRRHMRKWQILPKLADPNIDIYEYKRILLFTF